jgi:hypothetical protein
VRIRHPSDALGPLVPHRSSIDATAVEFTQEAQNNESNAHTLTLCHPTGPVPCHGSALAVLAVVVAVAALVIAFVAMRDDSATPARVSTPPSQQWNVPDCPLRGRC